MSFRCRFRRYQPAPLRFAVSLFFRRFFRFDSWVIFQLVRLSLLLRHHLLT